VIFNYRLLTAQLVASLRPRRHPTLRLGGRRIRFLVVFSVAFPLMWLGSVIGMWLDNFFYPAWRRVGSRFPVFLVGNFRTGSTFLFRLLSRDRGSFTSLKTWELYFAPSVLQRRFWRGILELDRLLGSPLRRRITEAEDRVFSEVRLHRIRLEEPEEDEALFCLPWHTLFSCFFFPFVPERFPYLRFDDELRHPTRRRLMAFYRGCIERHLYAHRSRGHYLSKNPSATSKIRSLLEEYPEARFICLYRDPVEAVPSTMRWFAYAWHYFSSAPERYPLRGLIVEMMRHWYRYPLDMAEGPARERILFVSYEDIVGDVTATVRRIYTFLGLRLEPDFLELLRREAEQQREYRADGTGDLEGTGLTAEEIRERFRDVTAAYGELLGSAPQLGRRTLPRRQQLHAAGRRN